MTSFHFCNFSSELVSNRNLLNSLFRSLLETIRRAALQGAPPNDVNHFDASSSTDSMLSSLRFLSTYGEENMEISSILAEVDGGAVPQHMGRSSIAWKIGSVAGKGYDTAMHQYLLEKTTALVPPTLDSFHAVLSHRRYSVCISDLKCVLAVNGISRHFASYPSQEDGIAYLETKELDNEGTDCALDDWIKVSIRSCGPPSLLGIFCC
jgi:hypothetical protein